MIKWSFSSLKQFVNCPRQYYEVKVQSNFKIKETEQIRYGTEVHKALEEYVRDNTPLPKNYLRFKDIVDSLTLIDGEKLVEYKMALDADKNPCAFDSPDYWVRGIVDLLILDGDTAYIVDYKTGSAKYPDVKQLRLMALMTYAHFPQIMEIKAGLLFLLNNVFIDQGYHRNDSSELWSSFTGNLARLQLSYDNDSWPPNPTPLCGWCPVSTCEFQKER